MTLGIALGGYEYHIFLRKYKCIYIFLMAGPLRGGGGGEGPGC